MSWVPSTTTSRAAYGQTKNWCTNHIWCVFHSGSDCASIDGIILFKFHDEVHDNHEIDPTRVLLVADPQVLNLHSYPDRSHTLSWLSEVFTDLNMRKSWKAVSTLHPDNTMFIGDMMDNGRAEMSDEE